MERVTGELRDSLIAGFGRQALHLEMRTCTRRPIMAGSGRGWLANRWIL